MKKLQLFILFLISSFCFSQKTIPEVLQKYNLNSVPYITVGELKSSKNIVLLDTREVKEFNVSHIENAICVGFDKFNKKKTLSILNDKNATIIVYCSIGVRSEKIGKKLIKLGYKNVKNLYGGIFEWKNLNEKIVDNSNSETQNVHAFSKEWSVFLKKGIKVYE